MWTFPTLEPAIVSGGSFVLDRVLDESGDVSVHVGDQVTPETIVARTAAIEKPMTMFVASELGVPNNNVSRYLTKPVGSAFRHGEVIARSRRGLRTVSVTAPSAGTLTSVDESGGTIVFSAAAAPDIQRALVNGEVERVLPDRGAIIRATGSRVFGILGFGTEAIGTLIIGLDRADRELTPDQVKDSWKGCVVLCGMTVSVPALNRLKQAGVAGIIVGSLAEADVRRFLSSNGSNGSNGELSAGQFWSSSHPNAPFARTVSPSPFVIVAIEGFGRIPMAETVFSFLREHDGQTVSINAETSIGDVLHRPEIYITHHGAPNGSRVTDDIVPGRPVRLVGGRYLGTVATLQTPTFTQTNDHGNVAPVARVQLPTGEQRVVPVTNLEVLV